MLTSRVVICCCLCGAQTIQKFPMVIQYLIIMLDSSKASCIYGQLQYISIISQWLCSYARFWSEGRHVFCPTGDIIPQS